MGLAEKRCVPCEGGIPRIEGRRRSELLAELDGWELDGERLRRRFRFADFGAALRFVDAVGAVAEEQGHHPDILLHDWNRVDVSIWTHAIGGLSENDFILAAHLDRIPSPSAPRT